MLLKEKKKKREVFCIITINSVFYAVGNLPNLLFLLLEIDHVLVSGP